MYCEICFPFFLFNISFRASKNFELRRYLFNEMLLILLINVQGASQKRVSLNSFSTKMGHVFLVNTATDLKEMGGGGGGGGCSPKMLTHVLFRGFFRHRHLQKM